MVKIDLKRPWHFQCAKSLHIGFLGMWFYRRKLSKCKTKCILLPSIRDVICVCIECFGPFSPKGSSSISLSMEIFSQGISVISFGSERALQWNGLAFRFLESFDVE